MRTSLGIWTALILAMVIAFVAGANITEAIDNHHLGVYRGGTIALNIALMIYNLGVAIGLAIKAEKIM
jgi:hypothetical protein